MVLLEFVAQLLAGVALMVAMAGLLLIKRDRASGVLAQPGRRAREIAPHLLLLGGVLALNRAFRHLGQEVSWVIGWNITDLIYAIEGNLVATIQTVASPPLTVLFSFVYLYGYVFLTVFPLVAYLLYDGPTPIRKTLVAYTTNYALGLVCYTLFIAYGPRNLIPETVDALLYAMYPASQLLTSTVNANTNAFPSLHASLSVTVVLLARRTRTAFPVWYALSVPLAGAVVVSTMYLGIHWAIDVVAGVVLAVVSVRVADRYHRFPPSLRPGLAEPEGRSGTASADSDGDPEPTVD